MDLLPALENNNPWHVPEIVEKEFASINYHLLNEDYLNTVSNRVSKANESQQIGLLTKDRTIFESLNDLILILLSGHQIRLKASENDTFYYKWLLKQFKDWEDLPVALVETMGENDSVVLNGFSENKSIHNYFKSAKVFNKPNLISCSILSGNETDEDLTNISKDLMSNFGLGKRNSKKLFVPDGFDFVPLLTIIDASYPDLKHHHKYRNHFDYQLSILLLNRISHRASDGILLKEGSETKIPISVVNFETYNNQEDLTSKLNAFDYYRIYSDNNIPDQKAMEHGSATIQPSLSDKAESDLAVFLLN